MCEKVHEKKEDPGSLVFISGFVTFLHANFRGTFESELDIISCFAKSSKCRLSSDVDSRFLNTPNILVTAAVRFPQVRNCERLIFSYNFSMEMKKEHLYLGKE